MADGAVFDLCVVGAGLIGSAAARHASARPGVKVCLIGPDEPKERSLTDGRDIYGAHYDEGRITRACSTSVVWSKLAIQSINRYRDMERHSGIKFYDEVGGLMVGSKEFIQLVEENAKITKIDYKTLNSDQLKAMFPFFKFSSETFGIYEPKNAGNVSPRKMLQAQKTISARQGCLLIKEIVNKIERKPSESGSYAMIVVTDTGRKIECKSVLVATGAFTSFRDLLPGLSLDVSLCPIAVALVEITKAVADRLRSMPSVIFSDGRPHPDWYKDDIVLPSRDLGYYLLSPVTYPDGRCYIKLGLYHNFTTHIKIRSADDAKRWFVNGNKDIVEFTKNLLLSLFEDLPIESWHGDSCIVVETPTFLPYIDKVHAQLGVATGGNGHAAKSSDEIGKLAAGMMFDEWESDIPRDVFRVKVKQHNSNL